mgnify:CR=1 FL=1
MFGGILTILIAIWVYRSSIQAKTGNALYWTAGAAVLFFIVQMLFYNVNIMIIDVFGGTDIGDEYDRDLLSIDSREGETALQEGFFGGVLGVLFELFPLLAAWFSVAFVRVKFMLKQDFNLSNLVGGIGETFSSIGNSFKTKS